MYRSEKDMEQLTNAVAGLCQMYGVGLERLSFIPSDRMNIKFEFNVGLNSLSIQLPDYLEEGSDGVILGAVGITLSKYTGQGIRMDPTEFQNYLDSDTFRYFNIDTFLARNHLEELKLIGVKNRLIREGVTGPEETWCTTLAIAPQLPDIALCETFRSFKITRVHKKILCDSDLLRYCVVRSIAVNELPIWEPLSSAEPTIQYLCDKIGLTPELIKKKCKAMDIVFTNCI